MELSKIIKKAFKILKKLPDYGQDTIVVAVDAEISAIPFSTKSPVFNSPYYKLMFRRINSLSEWEFIRMLDIKYRNYRFIGLPDIRPYLPQYILAANIPP